MNAPEQELIIAGGEVAAYNPCRAQLSELAATSKALVFDYEDVKGNKAARSHIATLRKTKTAIEEVRKKEKKASLDYGRLLDAEANEIKTQIDELIEQHDAPLREIAEKEESRKNGILHRANAITAMAVDLHSGMASVELIATRAEIEAVVVDGSFQEFAAFALDAKADAIKKTGELIAAATQREELELLRAEQAKAEQEKRESEIAERAAAKAKQEAEEAAKRARDEEAAKHAKELEDARRREAQQKADAERAEREKRQAEERHAADLAQAVKDAEAKAAREQAAAEAKAKEEAEAAAKLATNKKHRKLVLAEAIAALTEAFPDANPGFLSDVITAIDAGKIPRVAIHY